MSQSAPVQASARMTVSEFLAAYEGVEGKYELVEGVPVAMAGASLRHNRIVRNLISRIDERLRGGPCEVLPSDMGLLVSIDTYRLPDLGIYCDPRDVRPADINRQSLDFPKVLIEVLSRSTQRSDYVVKLDEYQAIASVDTVVFVHNTRDAFTTFERVSNTEWRTVVHLPGQPLVLRDPAMTIPAAEIFAGTQLTEDAAEAS